jgi:2-polyprenyl-6-methoxyphenol hydroxylase-like FAD-dependent oxidoreductase
MPAGRSQFSWFRPVEYPRGLRQICTDASGRCHGDSIAPPLMRREVLAGLQVSAAALLAPQIAALVAAAPQLILQPIFDLESPGMAFGRAVLVGDAAFVARPHVGTGVTKAALDAQCLADALHAAGGDVDAALERFERERLPAGRDLVARGRYLGSYLEGRANRDRDPAQVMREFGSAGIIAR